MIFKGLERFKGRRLSPQNTAESKNSLGKSFNHVVKLHVAIIIGTLPHLLAKQRSIVLNEFSIGVGD